MMRPWAIVLLSLAAGGIVLPWHGAAAQAREEAAPASETSDSIIYRVRKGDTLYDLAKAYFRDPNGYDAVARLNKVRDPRRMPVGRPLEIPLALLRDEVLDARVIAFRGDVRVAGAAGVRQAAIDMPLAEGERLETGANSFVTFELSDETRVTIPSQSRIRIERLSRPVLTGGAERLLVVETGRVQSVVTPMTEPRDRFLIRTPLTVSAVRGTDFRVSYDAAAQRTTSEVIDGAIAVASLADGTLQTVPEAAGLATTAAGSGTPSDLLPPPTLERPGRVQADPSVTFAIRERAPGQRYRAQLANDGGFVDIFAEGLDADGRLEFADVPSGTYFARFTALGADGVEGMPVVYGFDRQLNTLDLGAPSAVGEHKRRSYLFRWYSSGAGARTFRFQMSTHPDGSMPVIDQPGLSEPRITITDLPSGAYYWRVGTTQTVDGRIYQRWSEPQQFQIDVDGLAAGR